MKFIDYLFPGVRKAGGTIESKVGELRTRLKDSRASRDHYKTRAHAAEQSLKHLTRAHLTDPHRCRAILNTLLDEPPAPELRDIAGLLQATSPRIDVEDDMIWSADTASYFRVGLEALQLIHRAAALIPAVPRPLRMLDLPCGHGRAMRWMRAAYPGAELYGCDVQQHGMAFCQVEFGSKSLAPADFPAAMICDVQFDLIWIGSLFTHLTRWEFDRFLLSLPRLLTPGGIVIFTTHGTGAWDRLNAGDTFHLKTIDLPAMRREHAETGFTYAPYERTPDYGVSFSTQSYVTEKIADTDSLVIRDFKETTWGGLQDVFVCQMPAGGP